MKTNLKLLAMSLFVSASAAPAVAIDTTISQRTLAPLEIFKRCYAHLTQLRLPTNHPLRAAVAANTLSPVDACMQILGAATLNSSGTILATTTVNGINESLAVLRTMDTYHHTITENADIDASIPDGAVERMTRVFIDEGEFGLHFTRALFTPMVNVTDIVRLGDGLEAIRSAGSAASATSLARDPAFTFTAPTVQTGTFLGVRPMSANAAKTNLSITIGTKTFNLHKSDGGGVLGTQSNLLLNFGRGTGETMNGGLILPRRWSRSIYKDILCRELPVLRQSDGAALVQTTITPSTPSFRKTASCMSCHGSMDPMAGTARNFSLIVHTGKTPITNMTHAYKYSGSLAAETGVVDADKDFYLRPSNGRLYFRSYDGTLVDKPVTSIADLGAKIAETDDFYACTASRYFRFFTGINVNLQDEGDPSLPAIPSGDLFYRNQVIQMGKNLRTSGSIQSLIREILSSDVYKRASLRGSQ